MTFIYILDVSLHPALALRPSRGMRNRICKPPGHGNGPQDGCIFRDRVGAGLYDLSVDKEFPAAGFLQGHHHDRVFHIPIGQRGAHFLLDLRDGQILDLNGADIGKCDRPVWGHVDNAQSSSGCRTLISRISSTPTVYSSLARLCPGPCRG